MLKSVKKDRMCNIAGAINHSVYVGMRAMSTQNGLPYRISILSIHSIVRDYEKAAREVVSDKHNIS